MEPKFKVGDLVTIKEIPTDKDSQPGWVKSMDKYVGKQGTISAVLDFQDCGVNSYSIKEFSVYTFRENWIASINNLDGLIIQVSELKRIHDIACESWKTKIQSMVNPFQETVFVSGEQIDKMLKAATSNQLPIVEDVFRDYLKESKPELFNFGYVFSFDHGLYKSPIHIRHGRSTPGNNGKEIGFNEECTPILVDKDGKETELTGSHYLKFKVK